MNRKQRRAGAAQGGPGARLEAIYAEAMLHQRAGRAQAALACFERAAALAPDFAPAQYNLGTVLAQLGRREQALAAFQKAVRLAPGFAEAQANLGTALMADGRLDEAVAALRKAAALAPGNAVALNNLGAALQQQGRLGEAAGAYRAALAVSPSYPEALCNLAAVLADLRQLDEADAVCAQALAAAPSMAKAQNVLGVVRRDQGRLDEAVAAFRAAIALAPAEPDAYVNLGDALAAQGPADQQVALCAQAAALAPDSARAQNNLGTALYMAGRLPEATGCFRRATQLQPEGAEGHFHLGMALLAAGDMAAGWREYEWRWRTPLLAPARRGFAQPVWDGRACGKTLLIHAEQGFGDTLQFCRYAPLAAARGLRVILEVPGVLAELLGGLPGVAQVVARGDALPAFDVHAPMLSLPYIFGTVLETVPGTVAYLAADAQAAAAMAARLGRTGKTGLRAGIVWAGNSYREAAGMAAVDRRRSIAPDRLAPLLDVPGVHFVSLQKDRPAPAAFGLTDFMDDIGDFAGTAALVDNLDLVIAVDTAVAHLAGALGKPVWLLNRYDSEWRWMLGRADSPWYPTMRIFRQAGPGDWDGVIEEVARALAMTV